VATPGAWWALAMPSALILHQFAASPTPNIRATRIVFPASMVEPLVIYLRQCIPERYQCQRIDMMSYGTTQS